MKKALFMFVVLFVLSIFLSSCTFEFVTEEPIGDKTQEENKGNEQKDPIITKCKVLFFDGENKLNESEFDKGTSLNLPNYNMTDNQACRYTFKGWDANSDGIIETSPYKIESDVTFMAIYDIEYINYHYDIYVKDELVVSNDCHYGDEIEYPTVNSEIIGDDVYFFQGWKYNDKPFDGLMYLQCGENLTISAVYADTQIAKFYYDGSLYANIIEANTPLTYLVDWNITPPDGYNIVWYTDSEYKTPSEITNMVEGNLTLYGILEKSDRGTLVNSKEELLAYFNKMMINRTVSKSFDLNFEIESVNSILSYLTSNAPVIYNYGVSAVTERKMLTINIEFSEMATTTSEHILYTQVNCYDYIVPTKTRENNTVLAVDLRVNSYNVTHSDTIYYALEHGYKPVIDSSDTKLLALYNKMREVLINIISDTDTDIEKVTKIYEYLVMNVTYDKELLGLIENNSKDLEKYNSFYLEGVFNDKLAVCDGISKAFASLCQMEGINCVRVTGKVIESNVNHAWNKVYVNGNWYVVDVTSAGSIVKDEEILNYSYLLIDDQTYATYALEYKGEWDISCTNTYNYYETVGRDFDSQDDLEDYLEDFFNDIDTNLEASKYTTNFKISFDYESIDTLITSVLTNLKISKEISYSESLGTITIIYDKK